MSFNGVTADRSSINSPIEPPLVEGQDQQGQPAESAANNFIQTPAHETSASQSLENRVVMPYMPDEVLIHIFKHVLELGDGLSDLNPIYPVSKQFNRCATEVIKQLLIVRIEKRKKEILELVNLIEKELLQNPDIIQGDKERIVAPWINRCREYLKNDDATKKLVDTLPVIREQFTALNSFCETEQENIFKHIARYGFEIQKGFPENFRFEAAKIVAVQDSKNISSYIKKYELTEDHRFEVALISVSLSNYETSLWMRNYKLTEDHRFKIAMKAAAQSGTGISAYIKHYRLTKESERFEVAMLAAAQAKMETSIFIQNYELTEDHRFEVGKLVVQRGWDISMLIDKYELTENHRVEMAKIVAEKNGYSISGAISNYNLTKESDRFEVALIAVAQAGISVLEFITEYELTDDHRLEIAKKIASKGGVNTESLREGCLITEEQACEILRICSDNNSSKKRTFDQFTNP